MTRRARSLRMRPNSQTDADGLDVVQELHGDVDHASIDERPVVTGDLLVSRTISCDFGGQDCAWTLISHGVRFQQLHSRVLRAETPYARSSRICSDGLNSGIRRFVSDGCRTRSQRRASQHDSRRLIRSLCRRWRSSGGLRRCWTGRRRCGPSAAPPSPNSTPSPNPSSSTSSAIRSRISRGWPSRSGRHIAVPTFDPRCFEASTSSERAELLADHSLSPNRRCRELRSDVSEA